MGKLRSFQLRLGGLLALSLGICSASSAQTSAPLPTVIDECRIRLVEQVVIASDRAGLLVALPFAEGERVSAATIVARMADALPAAQLRLAQAKASSDVIIRQHRVELEMAQTELQKSEEANAKAKASSRTVIAVPELELVKLRLTIRKAELEIERATHELEVATKECALAQAEVDALQLKAPFAGIVNRCYRSVGEVIKPGDPVVEIVNPDKLRIEGRIPWAMLPLVQVGQSVRVSPQLEPSARKQGKLKSTPQAPLENHSAEGSAEIPSVTGVIGFIDATSDPVTHETRFWVEVQSGSAWLRPGLRARVEPVEYPVTAVSP